MVDSLMVSSEYGASAVQFEKLVVPPLSLALVLAVAAITLAIAEFDFAQAAAATHAQRKSETEVVLGADVIFKLIAVACSSCPQLQSATAPDLSS